MKFVQKEFGMKKEEILHKLKEIKPLERVSYGFAKVSVCWNSLDKFVI
ncbi:MAG: hypothetical protein IPG15_06015 [Arcobacter sp.]|nr:hypothetical protein [Arcobacter sp.]